MAAASHASKPYRMSKFHCLNHNTCTKLFGNWRPADRFQDHTNINQRVNRAGNSTMEPQLQTWITRPHIIFFSMLVLFDPGWTHSHVMVWCHCVTIQTQKQQQQFIFTGPITVGWEKEVWFEGQHRQLALALCRMLPIIQGMTVLLWIPKLTSLKQ